MSCKSFQTVFLSRPDLGKTEEAACLEVIRSGVLVQGPECEAFESEFADSVGAKHAVAVSSGTAALLLTIKALGLDHGDEVIIPSYTFIATANAVSLANAKVVLADVQPDTMNLDPLSVSQVLSKKTSLVVPVHQYGLAADLASLAKKAPGVRLLEDAACALGTRTEQGLVGAGPGVATCFSFHPRKLITTGEGGMITTSDTSLAARIRSLRQHGYGPKGILEPGYNLRMTEMSAALGRVQLRRLDEFIQARRRVASWYEQGLGNLDWIGLPSRDHGRVFQSYVVQVDEQGPVSRDDLVDALRKHAIQCQPGIKPVHMHTPYKNAIRGSLPISELLAKTALFLPMHASLTQAEVERVCSTIGRAA